MAPELEPGDLLVATRTGLLRPGDLVVVEHPERPGFELVKRLTALPGEYVGALALGPDEHWVAGEHTGSSTDSNPCSAASSTKERDIATRSARRSSC